jgi:hypothetical protein
MFAFLYFSVFLAYGFYAPWRSPAPLFSKTCVRAFEHGHQVWSAGWHGHFLFLFVLSVVVVHVVPLPYTRSSHCCAFILHTFFCPPHHAYPCRFCPLPVRQSTAMVFPLLLSISLSHFCVPGTVGPCAVGVVLRAWSPNVLPMRGMAARGVNRPACACRNTGGCPHTQNTLPPGGGRVQFRNGRVLRLSISF